MTLCSPMDCILHGILQARIPKWVAFPSLGDLLNPGIKPRSSALQADSLLSESPGKPKITGVGSLSLLQGDLLDPGNELDSPAMQADSLPAQLPGKPEKLNRESLKG